MNFLIADSFTDSLGRLTGAEQKAAKTTAFDLQLDPTGAGKSFHKLKRAKDENFWSVRASDDLRLIVHKTGDALLLCYVGHHDDAYRWAERRRIECHPTTGAAQLVELEERREEVTADGAGAPVPPVVPTRALFAHLDDDALLGYGVPEAWLAQVRAAGEEELYDLVDHLPQEAAEALLELATGGTPAPPRRTEPAADPFAHPDAQRRFRLIGDAEELARALEYPWERWTVFLHPAQRELVERRYGGPARVAGSAGTGKTIVALHRAVWLARQEPEARVLLTTFSKTLARALTTKLHRLIGDEPRLAERIDVKPLKSVGYDLYRARFGQPNIASLPLIRSLVETARGEVDAGGLSTTFLLAEWRDVVDAWQVGSWDAYREVPRLGRKTRLGQKQREAAWRVFEAVQAGLRQRKAMTWAQVFGRVADALEGQGGALYDLAVVDEAQDIAVSELRLLSRLCGDRADGLFFAGDLGQRIFQPPFSWKALGVDVRGRSYTLKINYRTSHQIRRHADLLLPSAVTDVDGIAEGRRDTISVFDGPAPTTRVCDDEDDEVAVVGAWLGARASGGMRAHELGLFVRSEAQIKRAMAAVKAAGLVPVRLDEDLDVPADKVAVGTMHLAKGLEFRAVVVMACDDEVVPLQERIETVSDQADLEEVYATERHLLYVACTRAREELLLTGVDPASEFLDDLTR